MFPKDIKKVLLLDGIDPVCQEVFTQNGIEAVIKETPTPEQLLQLVQEYDAVVVRSATKVTAEALQIGAQTRLKVVGRAGTGTDNIDVTAATRYGVIVMNTPGGNTISAAEHTCSLICTLGRFIPQACASLKAGQWNRKQFMGSELYGKTLAIVGLGRIGREVASRMQSFGMTTIGYDPFVSFEDAKKCNIEKMELEELWPRCDYITVHTPLLPHTRNLISKEVLTRKCKKGVKIVNVARGGIVDEEALLDALNSGHCGGAALDVFVNEPPQDFTLCSHPKVVCTPHLGASTREAQIRVAKEIAEQISEAVEGKRIIGLVNAHALNVTGEEASQWMDLATRLGSLSSSLVAKYSGQKVTLSLEAFGERCASYEKSAIKAALAGYLSKVTSGKANVINASSFAVENNVEEKSSRTENSKFNSSFPYFCVSASCESESFSLFGTVQDCEKLLLSVNGSLLETPIALRESRSYHVFVDSMPFSELCSLGIDICAFSGVRPESTRKYFVVSSESFTEFTGHSRAFLGTSRL